VKERVVTPELSLIEKVADGFDSGVVRGVIHVVEGRVGEDLAPIDKGGQPQRVPEQG
jgi:hypothetical protein